MVVPVVIRMKIGKLKDKDAKKITIINAIIVRLFFYILMHFIELGVNNAVNMFPISVFSGINYGILCETRREKMEREKKKLEEAKLENKKENNNDNKFEEVKKYKDLLDSGIISQEEFDKKKKELFL